MKSLKQIKKICNQLFKYLNWSNNHPEDCPLLKCKFIKSFAVGGGGTPELSLNSWILIRKQTVNRVNCWHQWKEKLPSNKLSQKQNMLLLMPIREKHTRNSYITVLYHITECFVWKYSQIFKMWWFINFCLKIWANVCSTQMKRVERVKLMRAANVTNTNLT